MGEKRLSEKDFIQESYGKDPYPMWIWLGVLLLIVAALWSGNQWYRGYLQRQVEANPFLQVTNREMSLFLWQFPEHMRSRQGSKARYMPGFDKEQGAKMEIANTEEYVVAPPEVLFLYHHWKRVIGMARFVDEVSLEALTPFLEALPEWHPHQWEAAPASYRRAVVEGEERIALPLEVAQAYIGWLSYFQLGQQINGHRPTYGDARSLLEDYPGYARGFWRNMVIDIVPDYLQGVETAADETLVPPEEMAGFLRLALYHRSVSR